MKNADLVIETPEAPKHEHTACPTCGKCTAADCDGAEEDKCAGHEVAPELPTEGVVTLAQAIEIANKQAHNTYTTGKFTVTGTVNDLYNTQYGNMHLIDADGNDLTIYGLYIEGQKYGDYTGTKPVAGDVITVTGVLGTYNGKPQMKNADLVIETPEEHKHTEEVLPAKEATCTETGLTEGKKCSTCGEILVAQEEVAAKGHTEEVLAAKEATCTETGLTEGKKCSVCGEVLVAQEEVAAKGHSFTEGKCTVCGADDPDYVAPEKPDMTLIDEFAAILVADFNATGASDAKVTVREDFKATTHPNIKYVFGNEANLAKYKWFFEFSLVEMKAAATANNYLDTEYYTSTVTMLEGMIAGDITAVGLASYADARTLWRFWIEGLLNAKLPATGVSYYQPFMVDYSVAENLKRFDAAYAASKEVAPEQPELPETPAGFQGEPAGTIAVGCYSNTGLASGIYFCDNAGVTPNNSLRWQYKLVLKYDAEKDAYLVVAADAAKASATSAAGSADAWTHAIASASVDVSTYATVGQYIVVEEELSTEMAAFTAKVYNADQWA